MGAWRKRRTKLFNPSYTEKGLKAILSQQAGVTFYLLESFFLHLHNNHVNPESKNVSLNLHLFFLLWISRRRRRCNYFPYANHGGTWHGEGCSNLPNLGVSKYSHGLLYSHELLPFQVVFGFYLSRSLFLMIFFSKLKSNLATLFKRCCHLYTVIKMSTTMSLDLSPYFDCRV